MAVSGGSTVFLFAKIDGDYDISALLQDFNVSAQCVFPNTYCNSLLYRFITKSSVDSILKYPTMHVTNFHQ